MKCPECGGPGKEMVLMMPDNTWSCHNCDFEGILSVIINKTKVQKMKEKSQRVKMNELRLKKFFMQWCPDVKDIIFNNPVTICILKDGRKGVVKVQNGDKWSAEKGMLYAYIKACKQWIYKSDDLKELQEFASKAITFQAPVSGILNSVCIDGIAYYDRYGYSCK